MDVFKKIVSDRLRTQAGQTALATHPDADTLSAFAERALSDSERVRVLEHIGGCRECRDTLFLALPSSQEMQREEMQRVVVPSRRSPAFALRWGTLAAAVAIGAILLVTARKRADVAVNKSAEGAKVAPVKSAELKTPPEIAEMRALRDDRAAAQKEADKIIPTPKRMTARPAGSFDIDQSGQVRMMPRSEATPQVNGALNGRNFTALNKLDSVAPAASSAGAIGGAIQSNTTAAYGVAANQFHGAAAGAPGGVVGGTIVDPSGAVVANATVTVNGPIGTRAQQSDGRGQFAFDRLAPGSYSVVAQAPGFRATELRQVAVVANQSANLQVQLQIGAASETVEVSGEQTAIVTSAQVAQAEIQTKPVPSAAKDAKTARAKVAQNSQQVASSQVESLQVESFAQSEVAFKKAGAATALTQWTLAPDGTVQRSFDGGASWQAVAVPGPGRFRALSSSGSDIWVGGKAGALFHSSDAGQSWKTITPIIAGRKLQSDITRVDFSDAFSGTITTATGQSWTTSDGGQSWRLK